MELKEFISQSLLQIFEGVHQAQNKTKEIGGSIAKGIIAPNRQHPSIIGFNHKEAVILVDFDVSLTTADLSKEKAGLGIFVAAIGGGAQLGSESSNNQFSRVRFSIPVTLPVPQDEKLN